MRQETTLKLTFISLEERNTLQEKHQIISINPRGVYKIERELVDNQSKENPSTNTSIGGERGERGENGKGGERTKEGKKWHESVTIMGEPNCILF